MKYIWILSLVFFAQLSWSADTAEQTPDHLSIMAEAVCKDWPNPETCKEEYIADMTTLLIHALGKTVGLSHIPAQPTSVMDYSQQTSSINTSVSQFCETYYAETVEECLFAFDRTGDILVRLRDVLGLLYKQ